MIDKTIYKDAPNYCHYFFDLVQTDNLIFELENSRQKTRDLIALIKPERENFAYATNKWTTKEVLRHIIDCERVYIYRAFRFSRFDNTELTGFDENEYIDRMKSINFTLADLLSEYLAVRQATISLYKTMTAEMLDFNGIANKFTFTARTLGFMAVGHNLHHCDFIKAKYLTTK